MDIITPLNNSLALLSRLREISKNINEAEIKNIIADLSMELSDTKLAGADLKEQILTLRKEVSELKAHKLPEEKPDVKSSCYYFDGDSSRLYCTACYDSKGAKSLTSKGLGGNHRRCGVCKAILR